MVADGGMAADAGSDGEIARDAQPQREFDIMMMGATGPITRDEAADAAKRFSAAFERCARDAHLPGFSFVYRITVSPEGEVSGNALLISQGFPGAFQCASDAAQRLGLGKHGGATDAITLDLDLTLALPSK